MVRTGRQEWETRIAEYRASGLSAAAWCRSNGVSPRQLYYWLSKIDGSAKKKPSAPRQWLSVEADEPQALLVRVGQATVEVKPGFDAALLADVVRTLAALC